VLWDAVFWDAGFGDKVLSGGLGEAPRTATCPARARGLRERLPPCARAGL